MSKQRMPEHVAQAVIERAEGTCEAMIPGCCVFQGSEIHHRKLRSQGGKHDLDTCCLLCTSCHRWVHANVAESYEMELLVHGWQEPVHPPAYYRGRVREEEEDE